MVLFLYIFLLLFNGLFSQSPFFGLLITGIIPMFAGIVPMVNGIILMFAGIMPMFNGIIPMFDGIMPMLNGIMPMVNGIMPMVNGIILMFGGIMPMFDGISRMFVRKMVLGIRFRTSANSQRPSRVKEMENSVAQAGNAGGAGMLLRCKQI
jgi:hypothetical protein